jgi:tellurite resistance protein
MSDRASELEPTAASFADPLARDRRADEAGASSGWRQLESLPVGLFGSVMGLTGLSVAWRLAHARYGTPDWLAGSIAVAAITAFVGVTLGYGVKLAIAPNAVRAEFHHPIAGNLFGTFLISLLLLPIIVAPASLLLARAMWITGSAGMLGLAG